MKNLEYRIYNGEFDIPTDNPDQYEQECWNCHCSFGGDNVAKFCSECGSPMNDEASINKQKEAMRLFQEEKNKAYNKLKIAVLEDLGVADHKNADKLWSYVIKKCDDSTVEIYETVKELSELLR